MGGRFRGRVPSTRRGKRHEAQEVAGMKALVVILMAIVMLFGVIGAASASEQASTQMYFSAAPVEPAVLPEATPTILQVAAIAGMVLLLSTIAVWALWCVLHRGAGSPPTSWGLHAVRGNDYSTKRRRSTAPNKGTMTSVSASRGA